MKHHRLFLLPLLIAPSLSIADHYKGGSVDLTHHWIGYLSLAIFSAALLLVILEEIIDLRKSKPMLISAGLIWGLIGWSAQQSGTSHLAESAVRHNLLQYAELMLLMLVVMTYVNAMSERQVFNRLRQWVCEQRYSYRQLFWLTGAVTFCLSPFLDNLSAALLMGAVVISIGHANPRFVGLGCLNVVIAANAGGAFSPFGDITTLMVWQQNIMSTTGRVEFHSFFALFLPALLSYLIPISLMHFALPQQRFESDQPTRRVTMLRGARRIILLFLLTIATAVCFQGLLHLPAVIGILTGLSYLQIFGFYLKMTHKRHERDDPDEDSLVFRTVVDSKRPFDVFIRLARIEWDTLLFLCGILLSVGGLGYLGYLALASDLLYSQWGATTANLSVGLASAALENVSTLSLVLAMQPEMSLGQWLLVTLATGIGGSLLSIGSANGVALMGQSQGNYTFFSHLKWTPAIGLGFAAGIYCHLWLNAALF